MERRHAQGSGTTSLYLANTGYGEVGGQRFRGHGLVVGRGKKSIFDSSSFGEVSCWDDLLPKRSKLN